MEWLDVLDENGNYTGKSEERQVVHNDGLWHIHVGVWIMNKKGELLFQKRSMEKKVNPGKWSRTGGHVDSGETPLEAIQRETYEEIGVKIPTDKFKLLSIRKEEVYLTNYKVIKETNKYSMLDIEIKTGRKNQIRVHLNDIGHSILGDKKYGNKKSFTNRLMLHANYLCVINPKTNKKQEFISKTPKLFEDIFKEVK